MERFIYTNDEDTLRLLNSIYYRTMMIILERCIEVCDIDDMTANALRYVMLKPMNFKIIIDDEEPILYNEFTE